MKILALDSSGLVASVAVVSDDNLIGEYTINYKKTHSQTLLPMLDEVAKMTELDLKTIDFIAVSAGPGSFTGLRIGSATAKGLAMALDKQIVSVPTVDALAYNLWGSGRWWSVGRGGHSGYGIHRPFLYAFAGCRCCRSEECPCKGGKTKRVNMWSA